eukprot:321019-Amorphochlora_amoeboformis.AAC.1
MSTIDSKSGPASDEILAATLPTISPPMEKLLEKGQSQDYLKTFMIDKPNFIEFLTVYEGEMVFTLPG